MRKFAVIMAVVMLVSVLCSSCGITKRAKGKEFNSPEAMISEMTGTYAGSDEQSGARIVISGSGIIKYNVDSIFPEISDDDFFWENFPNEDWAAFNIDALLGKAYIDITTEPVSADMKESTISGLWVDKDGVLFTQEGYPFRKISSDSAYPTTEMQERFEEYHTYLQEYEKSIMITEAESYLLDQREALEAALSSATLPSSVSRKSTASAEIIAKCAFKSLENFFKYPRTAKLESYWTNPRYDSYGRVATCIVCTYQNGFGNYITEDIYVVLQSCSASGEYSYRQYGMHYSDERNYFEFLLAINDWDEDPNEDEAKETPYNEAIQLVKNGDYLSAAEKLEKLGEYKAAERLKEACVSYSAAEKYKKAVDLFTEGKYTKASEELSALGKDHSNDYLRIERVIALCNAAVNKTSENDGNTANDGNAPNDGNTSNDGNAPDDENTKQPDATHSTEAQNPQTQPSETQDSSVCSHNYLDATCTEPATCMFCGETNGTALGHTFSEATCVTPKTCALCGETSGTALDHSYSEATCTEPQTCTQCGQTNGAALGHNYSEATCVAPKTCKTCGETTGDVAGHTWKDATCTEPATCTTCGKTSGEAKGHIINVTKCEMCDYSDFSMLAKSYSDVDAYDSKTGAGYEVTNVSIDSSGILSFSFKGNTYSLTLRQSRADAWEAYFDCYYNGVLEPDAEVRVTQGSRGYTLHLSWDYLEGCQLYFNTQV